MKRTRRLTTLGAILLGLAVARPAPAATFEVAFASIELLMVRYVMTDNGRYYMQGDSSSPCRYALLQEPRIDAEAGRLRMTFLFSGRAAIEVAGRCRGAGDNFDVRISGVPAYSPERGEFYLADMDMESVDSSYFKVAAPIIQVALESRLRVSVTNGLERAGAFIAQSGVGRLSFENLEIEDIVVGEQAVRFSAEFHAGLRPDPAQP